MIRFYLPPKDTEFPDNFVCISLLEFSDIKFVIVLLLLRDAFFTIVNLSKLGVSWLDLVIFTLLSLELCLEY